MIELGHGYTLLPIHHECAGNPDRLYGYEWLHFMADGSPCSGVLKVCKEKHPVGEHTEVWTLEGRGQGLSLKPSLLCEGCGEHGFVTDDKWIGVGRGTQRPPQRPQHPYQYTLACVH